MHDLRVLRADDDIADGGQPCDVNGLLAEAKVPEEQPDDEPDGVPRAGRHLRRVQIGTEHRREDQRQKLRDEKVDLLGGQRKERKKWR